MIPADEKDSLTHLLEDANKQLQWIVKEIINQNRSYQDLLFKLADLDHSYKGNLILKSDIPDRISSIVNEFKEIRK